jgi:hypothetical protein
MCFQFKSPLKIEPKRGLGTLQLERKEKHPRKALLLSQKPPLCFFLPRFLFIFLYLFIFSLPILLFVGMQRQVALATWE